MTLGNSYVTDMLLAECGTDRVRVHTWQDRTIHYFKLVSPAWFSGIVASQFFTFCCVSWGSGTAIRGLSRLSVGRTFCPDPPVFRFLPPPALLDPAPPEPPTLELPTGPTEGPTGPNAMLRITGSGRSHRLMSRTSLVLTRSGTPM